MAADPNVTRWAPYFQEAAKTYPPIQASLLAAQCQQESGGDPSAKSGAGAEGLMQLMPATAVSLGVKNPLDPRESVLGGAHYLWFQFQRFHRFDYALAAYNAGPGSVEQYGGIPPFAQTEEYVGNILALQKNYLALDDPAPKDAPAPPAVPMPVLKPGDTGTAVAVLQRLLGATVDGVYGPRTQAAVLQAKARRGLPQNPTVGDGLWVALAHGG